MGYFEDKKLFIAEGHECIQIVRSKVRVIREVKDILGNEGGFLGGYIYSLFLPTKLLQEFLDKVQNYAVCDGLDVFAKLQKEYETTISYMMHGLRSDLKRMKDSGRAKCISFHMKKLDDAFKRMTGFIKEHARMEEACMAGDDDIVITEVVHKQQPIVIDDPDDDFED